MSRSLSAVVLLIVTGAVSAAATAPPGTLPDLERTGVVVPWEDFKKILEEIRRPGPAPTPVPPPVGFALSECAATASVDPDEDRIRVALGFELQVLEPEQWVEVPLIAEGVALESVRLDRQPARLFRKNGVQTLALKGAGRYRIDLEYLVAVEDSRGTRSARLRFPGVPAVAIDLVLPRADVDVQIDGAVLQATRRSAGVTRVRAALERVGDTTVRWFRRVESEDRETKVFAELASLVRIGEGVLRGSATASFTVHGRGQDRFRLELPADLTVLDVQANGLEEWQAAPVDGDPQRQLLEVHLSYLARGAVTFSLSYERQLAADTAELTLPDISARDVLRERGFLAVAAASNVEITPREGGENAAPVDPSELPPALAAEAGESLLYAFKYLRHPVVVPLGVVKHADVAVKRTIVESARLRTFATREGSRITSARYTVKNNRKQFLAAKLPVGAVLWGAFLEGQPVKASKRDDGVLLVPLRKTSTGPDGGLRPFEVEVVYLERERAFSAFGRRAFLAPILDVDVLELRWQLYLPRDRWYGWFGGPLEEDRPANRIARLGDAVYNLDNPEERSLLGVVSRDGKAYLTDGANEVPVGEVRVLSSGEEKALARDDLDRLSGEGTATEERDAEDERRPAQVQALSRRVPIPDPTPGQVMSNVALDQAMAQAAVGGRAVGVLPVRVEVPREGVRLSFTGRLLAADEATEVRVGYRPVGWALPRLGALATALLAFGLGLILLMLVDGGLQDGGPVRWVALAVGAIALVAVVFSGQWLASVIALAAAFGARFLLSRRRRQLEGGGGF